MWRKSFPDDGRDRRGVMDTDTTVIVSEIVG